ncbi:hypothetical protein [Nocardioides montaniterrae]
MARTTGQEQQRRDRLRAIGLLALGLGLLTTFGLQFILLMPTTYTATASVTLRPVSADQTADNVELSAHGYEVAMGTKEFAASVAEALDPSDRRPDVSVVAAADTGTATIRIAATSEDEDFAIQVANEVTKRGVAMNSGDSVAKMVVLGYAGKAGVTTKPHRKLYLGAFLALVAALLAGGLYRIRERT